MQNSLVVKVTRYWGSGASHGHDGYFVSKVYAIEGDKFLVYDNGEGRADHLEAHGFEWVDFTEVMPDPDDAGKALPVVDLWEDYEL